MGIYIREEGKIVRNAPLYTMIVPSSQGQSENKRADSRIHRSGCADGTGPGY